MTPLKVISHPTFAVRFLFLHHFVRRLEHRESGSSEYCSPDVRPSSDWPTA